MSDYQGQRSTQNRNEHTWKTRAFHWNTNFYSSFETEAFNLQQKAKRFKSYNLSNVNSR